MELPLEVKSHLEKDEWNGCPVIKDNRNDTIWIKVADFAELINKGESTIYKGIKKFLSITDLEREDILSNLDSGEHYKLEAILFTGLRVDLYDGGELNVKAVQFMGWAISVLTAHVKDEVLRKRISDLENVMTIKAEKDGTYTVGSSN